MKKFFTLVFTALMCITAMAQTASSLVGNYVSSYSWVDAWGDAAGPQTAVVSISVDDAGNILLGNLANMGGTLTGVYSSDTKTITFSGQTIGSNKVCTYPDLDSDVVATVSESGEISFIHVGVGAMESDKEEWYYRDLSTNMKKLNPTSSVSATYSLGDGSNVKGETTVYFYSIDDCDYDFGFELAGQLILVYNDGEDLELTNDVIEGINPAEEYSKLELTASSWWTGDKYWTLSGNNEKGALTLKGEYYTESSWLADPVEEGTFTLVWGGWDSIDSVSASVISATLYNIAGQRVANGTKGLLIKNGKKIVIK